MDTSICQSKCTNNGRNLLTYKQMRMANQRPLAISILNNFMESYTAWIRFADIHQQIYQKLYVNKIFVFVLRLHFEIYRIAQSLTAFITP